MTEARPIPDDELGRLFDWLENHLPVALAVSGGPDSMALMHLVARWLEQRRAAGRIAPGGSIPPVIVFTVDHGLRQEAADEANKVKRQAGMLGLPHETLVWGGDKPVSGVQAAARDARYGLMCDAIWRERDETSRENGGIPLTRLRSIVTAHHQDDQAETLLMRLARGSGVEGLSGMAAVSVRNGLLILRPLIEVNKDRLVATLEAAGVDWLNDPSNDDVQFERVRLRKARSNLEAAGLSNDKLALSARRLGRANAALAVATLELEARARQDHLDFTWGTLNYGEFLQAAEEVQIRLIIRMLAAYGGQDSSPRLVKVEELAARLAAGPVFPGATLCGCHITTSDGVVTICREPGRNGLPELSLAAGQCAVWDRRLEVCASSEFPASPELPANLRIVALGGQGWANLKQVYPVLAGQGIPARAAATALAIFQGNKLLAVPQLALFESLLRGPLLNGVPMLSIGPPGKTTAIRK